MLTVILCGSNNFLVQLPISGAFFRPKIVGERQYTLWRYVYTVVCWPSKLASTCKYPSFASSTRNIFDFTEEFKHSFRENLLRVLLVYCAWFSLLRTEDQSIICLVQKPIVCSPFCGFWFDKYRLKHSCDFKALRCFTIALVRYRAEQTFYAKEVTSFRPFNTSVHGRTPSHKSENRSIIQFNFSRYSTSFPNNITSRC